MQLWIVPLQIPPARAHRCMAVLDADERERAARFHCESLRAAFIAAHAALRGLLGAASGMAPASLRFRRGAWGKPSIHAPGGACGVHFNLSHADGIALIALSRRAAVGVDIETLARAPERAQDLHAVLSGPERTTLRGLPVQDQPLATYRCWVRKEALLKAAGCGIGVGGLDRFSVSCTPPARLLASAHPQLPAAGWSLRALESPGHWTAAVALAGAMPRALSVRHWHWDQQEGDRPA